MKFRGLLNAALVLILVQSFVVPSAVFAQADVNAAIRKEGMENSKIMNTLHYFSDVYGPRLTGSPNHVASAKWAAREMQSWGFQNTTLEPWEFGRPGWVVERAVGLMNKPVQDTLTFEVLAWTPSTKGTIITDAYSMILPNRPTQEELTNYFNSVRADVSGKIVLIGNPAVVPVNFNPPSKRIADAVMKCGMDQTKTPQECAALAGPGGPGGPPFGGGGQQQQPKPGALPAQQVALQLNQFLLDSGVALRVNDAGREHGQIRAFGAFNIQQPSWDVSKTVPTIVMRNEDFGRIHRLLGKGTPVRLEFDIRTRTVPDGVTSYNVVGELVGTSKKDEVILLGGHLDSWHSATGATDNAIGCAIMMEAARILKALDLKMDRTVRVVLWSGEEQGLLGSQAYVKQHFGTAENPTAKYNKFGGYFNIDSGTGKARGMSVFGPSEASAVLREALKSFEDYGFFGAVSTRSRNLGGSDHTSFNQAGLPGIGVQQDPVEYQSHTWHTNLDTYERIVEDDVKKSAIIVAAAVYHLATRPDLLPRFKAGEMPALPGAPSPSPTPTPR